MAIFFKKTLLVLFVVSIAFTVCGCPSNSSGGSGRKAGDEEKVLYQDITFRKLDGSMFNVSNAANGLPIHLVFFASWCKECPKEIPELNEMYKNYAAKGLVAMYAVAVGDPEPVAKKMISKYGIEYPVLLDSDEVAQKDFGVMGLPLNMVLSAEGEVIYTGVAPPSDDVLADVIIKK